MERLDEGMYHSYPLALSLFVILDWGCKDDWVRIRGALLADERGVGFSPHAPTNILHAEIAARDSLEYVKARAAAAGGAFNAKYDPGQDDYIAAFGDVLQWASDRGLSIKAGFAETLNVILSKGGGDTITQKLHHRTATTERANQAIVEAANVALNRNREIFLRPGGQINAAKLARYICKPIQGGFLNAKGQPAGKAPKSVERTKRAISNAIRDGRIK